MQVHAFAAKRAKDRLTPFSYDTKPLQPYEVLIAISHCGLCHSDVHLIDNDWGLTTYPLVPGHEIIGHVIEHGRDSVIKKKQRVGVSWQRSSCLGCMQCLSGHENLCPQKEATCIHHFGGFAHYIVADSRFVYEIPESLDSVHAGPLLCGGATVFAPLIHAHIQGMHTVGVVGIGGLGHLALQFAHAFGCKVIAFSHSKNKEKEASAFGATDFLLLDHATPEPANACDLLLSTTNVVSDWNHLLSFLKPGGKLCILGVPSSEVHFHPRLVIDKQLSLFGSPVASRAILRSMLVFAARHEIAPKIELFPMDQVNDAIQKLKRNEMRYRCVLATHV